jgi:hypothetical protein
MYLDIEEYNRSIFENKVDYNLRIRLMLPSFVPGMFFNNLGLKNTILIMVRIDIGF